MKYIYLISIFIISTLNLNAQLLSHTVGQKADGSQLSAKGYVFPQRIQSFSIDDSGELICFKFQELTANGKNLKGKGKIGLYSVNKKRIVWKKSINYMTNQIICNKSGILIESSRCIYSLDTYTGKKKWEQPIIPIRIEESLGILLGYRSYSSDILYAIKINDGRILWEQEIAHKYGWQDVYKLDSIQRIVIADNIYKLNILTGQKLELRAKTGVNDVKSNTLKSLMYLTTGVATGIMTGGYLGITPETSIINHLISDVIHIDSCYYFADRKHITCFNDTMGIVWQTILPAKKASCSQLFSIGNKLYMLNRGFALKDGKVIKEYGCPFIACFDKQSGKQDFFNSLSEEKRVIRDFILKDDALYILYEDGFSFHLLTEKCGKEAKWEVEKHGKLVRMYNDTIYWFDPVNQLFIPLKSNHQTFIVSNDQNNLFEVNRQLKVSKLYSKTLLYNQYLYFRDHILIGNNKDFRIIHKSGKEVFHFNIGLRCIRLIKDQLVVLDEVNRLLFIDLKDIL